jgi:hypothetical protein
MKLRVERELAKWMASKVDITDPNVVNPYIERVDPSLKNFLMESAEPKAILSKVLMFEPIRKQPKWDIVDPNL